MTLVRHREGRSGLAIHRRLLDCFAALAVTAALLLGGPAAAQTFPELTGRVVDQANLLSTTQELELAAKSEAIEKQTGAQFVVATVNSLEDKEIADYAYQLGRHWKIGDEKRDDGVILLVAPNERKVWIATGYGAEGILPDILAGRITRDTILPRFREGDMAGGIMAGADAVVRQLSLSPEQARAQADQAQQESQARGEGFNLMPLVFWGMMILFVLLSMGRRAGRGRRYRRSRGGISPWVVLWGLNELSRGSRGGRGGFGGFGGGGGFGGFSGGGGSFGGGGAGGSW